ncbi:hypothetical protein M0R45_011376 [Rubus argutus]|uniref:Uncharacterized protein n=1 Tax=Rubus argutus TaxID=59490 RepID=A0AAW1YCQ3_RUBAR
MAPIFRHRALVDAAKPSTRSVSSLMLFHQHPSVVSASTITKSSHDYRARVLNPDPDPPDPPITVSVALSRRRLQSHRRRSQTTATATILSLFVPENGKGRRR